MMHAGNITWPRSATEAGGNRVVRPPLPTDLRAAIGAGEGAIGWRYDYMGIMVNRSNFTIVLAFFRKTCPLYSS